jgi:DNA-binding HxlR family transcriptional regulator
MENAMIETEAESPVCEHFQRASEFIGKRWNPQIVRVLLSGVTRYSDLKASIPQISDSLLSERLKEMESIGIVTRDVTPTTPVLIEYHLTDRGRDLTKVIDELGQWAERWTRTPA